jgi:hypothetical protein
MPAETTHPGYTSNAASQPPVISDTDDVSTQSFPAQGVFTPAPSAPGPESPGPAPEVPASGDSRPALDVGGLRHPSEPSRLAFAAATSTLLIGLGLLAIVRLGYSLALLGLGALVIMALAAAWFAVQLYRARLLGGAVRVTAQTFPAFSAAVDEVKQQLDYTRRLEIFVADTEDQAVLFSYFGTHILLLKGDLVADLIKPGNRPQLDFIVATFVGKLKVKALAWAPLLIAIDALKLPHVFNFLIAPWERATVYTGDQIAAACCGSFDEAAMGLNRLMVGKDLAPSVGMDGLMAQAVTVRHRWLYRLQRLYARYPHMTDRYLNLLSFTGQAAPQEARTFSESLSDETQIEVRNALARSVRQRNRGPRGTVVPLAMAASVALLGAAAYGLFSPGSGQLVSELRSAAGTPSAAATPRAPTAAASLPPSSAPATPVAPGGAVAALRAHVPPAFAGTCQPTTPDQAMPGLVAAIACTPSGPGAPASVDYYQYRETTDMNAVFSKVAGGLAPGGTCDQGGQNGTYHFTSGPAAGLWACYYTQSSTGQMIWTSTALNILAVANDPHDAPQQLKNWFFSPALTGPQ